MAAETGEDRFERLIRQAHDGLPEPDPRRLATVEAGLVERLTTRRSGAWWFAALLVVGGAAAGIGAWLAGGEYENRAVAPPAATEATATDLQGGVAGQETETAQRDTRSTSAAPQDGGRAAVIFRGE